MGDISEEAVDKVVDFLDSWSYCPMSRPGDGKGRAQGLRDAASQLVATLTPIFEQHNMPKEQ